jgi:hypothetical protein
MTNATPILTGRTPANAAADIRDLKGALELPGEPSWWWWMLAAALLIGALLAFRWWRRRPGPASLVPAVPAHLRARQRLEQAMRLLSDPREFCSEVSGALRWYLEERFQLRAPERTTEEFLEDLRQTSDLNTAQKGSLATFLQSCDLVKFARDEPPEQALRDLQEAALHLVAETAPGMHDLPPVTAGEPGRQA